uniref:Endodeoxyribonuclease RusA n=1 Tax=Ackermannviridae sp. ctQad106 TaxID=2826820 RepID=A0A8S5QN61_9CAUD|nr:MAG TPA: Endodeoxyribonuclease RusA [Ackermannviridae sp. ctQad106]
MSAINLPIRFPGTNEYIAACRRNRFAGAKIKAEYTQAAALYFRGLPPVTGSIKLRFIWHEKTRRRDKDNVAFGKKFILDGMQEAGFLPNDNNKWVLGFEDVFVYDGRDGVEIEIIEKMEVQDASYVE